MTKNHLAVLVTLISLSAVAYLKPVCSEREAFRSRAVAYHNGICNWERGNSRCNTDGDCCPGRECDSFGYCKDCR